MDKGQDKIRRLAEALKQLVEFDPVSKEELTRWCDMAQKIIDDWEGPFAWPHFLWHYLSDADIRMKDAVYAEMQNERINELIKYLNRGVMPSDKDV